MLTLRSHPFQGPTNPIGLACIRRNLDVHCMRRRVRILTPEEEKSQSLISTFAPQSPEGEPVRRRVPKMGKGSDFRL